MPSVDAPVLQTRKRQLSDAEPETDSSAQPINKRQKLEHHHRHRTPSSFWDNLSRQWLTPRTLREFDRRTVLPAVPIPPQRSSKEHIDLAKLKRFARHGGPRLDDIRDYPDLEATDSTSSIMSSRQSRSRKRAKTGRASDTPFSIRRTSAYDPAFEQHLIDNGVYSERYGTNQQKPYNLKDINARLALSRASLSPSRFTDTDFLDFRGKNIEALTEQKVMSEVFPIIAGKPDIPSQGNLRFTNLKDLTDNSIVQAQPDSYDGARPEALNKQIREELESYIVPSTNTAAPCLPNFFAEYKGPKGLIDVNKLQACYDGSLGARGMHEAQSYIDSETAHDNKAYVITSTYHSSSGLLNLYTTHRLSSTNPDRDYEYHMTQLNAWAMTGSSDAFRQGATAFRNARDWAKEKREELISAANTKARSLENPGSDSFEQSFVALSSSEPTHPETSADEPALDINTLASSNRRTTVGIQKNSQPKTSSNRYLKRKKGSQNKRRPGVGS